LTDDNIERFGQQLIDLGSPLVANAGNTVIGVGANLVVVIIVAIFFLLEPMTYVRGIISLTPPNARVRTLEVMVELRNTLTTWLTALTFSISITAFMVWLVLGIILGVPNGLALGVIAGVATIIPNIGSIIPLVPIVIFTLADDAGKLPFVLGAYFAIQQLESNVMTPTIVKRELNIPAGLTFMFQLIAAALFGFLGILLAVPMLATLITLVRELYVYDILGMRNVEIDVEETEDGELKLVSHPSHMPRDTATVAVVNIPRKLPDSGDVEASPD
jgi:predicted PurR-regulated permease PerM